jgi:chromosome partitioning protein
MGKVLCIVGLKGGIGKTTTAINLSAAFAQKGKRTLLVDCDALGSSTTGLGLKKRLIRETLFDAFIGKTAAVGLVQKTGVDKLDLIPSNYGLYKSELYLTDRKGNETMLRNVLANLRDLYDIIVIDTPPSLGILPINAMTAADSYLAPVQCNFLCYESLLPLFRTIGFIRKTLNSRLKLTGLILTMHDAGENMCQLIETNIRKHFQNHVFQTVIPRSVQISESPVTGKPIMADAKNLVGATRYMKLADEVIERAL